MPKDEKQNICGAKNRKGSPCQLQAGWGTNHVGTGKCKLHGGASNGAPKKNKNAEKHGLFSKYLPEETRELIEEIQEISPLDILWQNITIQYAAIIRAQQIMHVKDKEELIKHTIREKISKSNSSTSGEKEYEIQFAWDRQERFLNAQARAMTNLTNMIMKYEELLKSSIATEEQQLRINKLKADINKTNTEIDKLKGVDNENNEDTIQNFLKATAPQVEDIEELYE